MSDMSKGIKIVSKGFPHLTEVIDLNTGQPIPRIRSLRIDAEAGEPHIIATLEVYVDELDVVVPGEKQKTELQTIEIITPPDEST